MATIDYREKYEQALERARQFSEKPYLEDSAGIVEYIFPELKESEDERIRKAIIEYLRQRLDRSPSIPAAIGSWIAWLEKHKYTEDDLDKAYKCADEVQYRRGYEDSKKEIEKQGEQKPNPCENCGIATNNCQKFPSAIRDGEQKSEIDPYSLPVSDDSSLPTFDESIYHPCTEEVHEQTPTDNEMIEILRAEYEKGRADAIEEMQNHTWSEEDSVMLGLCVDAASGYYNPDNKEKMKGWLYSLKNRVQPQPKQEWSEEDEKMLQNVLECLRHGWKKLPTDILKYESWLKSLRPQNTWKPSKEQLEVLNWCKPLWNEPKTKAVLESLINDLKKLKGE